MTSSGSRNFSTVVSGNGDDAATTSRPGTVARTAAVNTQGVWTGARRPTSALSTTQTQTAAAAAAAAATRRVSAPRARAPTDVLTTRDVGIGPCPNPASQEGAAKRAPFTVESVLPPIPQSFKCPITHEVMRDPVMTQDGHVYESDAIQEWFRRGHRTSPVTGAELVNLALLPEVPLRRAIEEYMALRPEIARRELTLRSDLLTLRNVVEKLEQDIRVKDKLLRDGNCAPRPEVAGSTSTSTSSASEGSTAASSQAQRSTSSDGEVKVEKGAPADNLRPVLATLPTPCRDSARGRKTSQHPPDSSPPSQPTAGRTNKFQELMKAMSWRGRTARRRASTARARSQDPDAHY